MGTQVIFRIRRQKSSAKIGPVLVSALAVLSAADGIASDARAQSSTLPSAKTTADPALPDPTLKDAYEAAFQRMLNNPGDLDITFAFAELAMRYGDFEGAISALERMLLINPDLPRVRLELGVLYFRIGSYAIARSYLQEALRAKDMPEKLRNRVEIYLSEANKRLSRHKFFGSIAMGARYQSNANGGPSSPAVLVGGVIATLNDEFTQQADYNLFSAIDLRHRYDLQRQDRSEIDTRISFYEAKQQDQEQLDLYYLRLSSGPRTAFAPDLLEGVFVRPYGQADYTWLENSTYSASFGGGIEAEIPIGTRNALGLDMQLRQNIYRNSADRPRNSQQDSLDKEISATFRHQTNRQSSIGINLRYLLRTARVSSNSYRQLAATGFWAVGFASPLQDLPSPWKVSLAVTRQTKAYRGIDLTIDPLHRRYDEEWRLGLSGEIPLNGEWALFTNISRSVVNSNQPNFDYTNTLISLGARLLF